MKATFNYTNRIDLERSKFEASILEQNGSRTMQVHWKDLPIAQLAGTDLVIEAFSSGEVHRFQIPIDIKNSAEATVSFPIDDLRSTIPRLRLKFIDNTHAALPMICAVLDQLRPSIAHDPTSIGSILPIQKEPSLEVAWRLSFEDVNEPVLLVCSDNELSEWLFTKSIIKSVVFPQVIEKIGEWLFALTDGEAEDEVPMLWTQFFKNLGVTRPDENSDDQGYLGDVRIAAQSAASAYSTKFHSLRDLHTIMNSEGD